MAFLLIPYKIKNQLEQTMADKFLLYDFIGNAMVESHNIGTILRFLGCAPTEKECNEFIKLAEFPGVPGFVHLAKFMTVMTEWLLGGRMKPMNLTELQELFAKLDPVNKGYFTTHELDYLFNEHGDKFTEQEMHIMRADCLDRVKNVCCYESYIYKLSHVPESCIYALAQQEEEKKLADEEQKKVKPKT